MSEPESLDRRLAVTSCPRSGDDSSARRRPRVTTDSLVDDHQNPKCASPILQIRTLKRTLQAELGDIIEKLTSHEAILTTELGELSTQAKRVGEQLDQVQSALSALRDGKPSGKHPLRNGAPRQKKRTATPAVIQEIVTIALGKQDRLLFDQLLDQIKSQLLARGLSRVGAKSLLADAIKKPSFTVHPDQTVSVN